MDLSRRLAPGLGRLTLLIALFLGLAGAAAAQPEGDPVPPVSIRPVQTAPNPDNPLPPFAPGGGFAPKGQPVLPQGTFVQPVGKPQGTFVQPVAQQPVVQPVGQPTFVPVPVIQPVGQRLVTPGLFGSFTPDGMLIEKVVPGGPADRAGIMIGDLIVAINNQPVLGQDQYIQAINTSGGLMQMLVSRGTTGEFGLIVVNLTNNALGRLQAPYLLGVLVNQYTPQGAVVSRVFNNTPAEQIGIRPGDMLVSINEVPITNQQLFFQVLANSSGHAWVVVRRGGQFARTRVRIPVHKFGTLGDYTPQGGTFAIVAPDTPASRAGLQIGDLVLSVNGRFIGNQAAFEQVMAQSNGAVVLRVRRGNFGPIGLVPVNAMNNSLGGWCVPIANGMRIETLGAGTIGARLGLQPGDIVYRVNGRSTRNLTTLQHSLEQARGLLMIDFRSLATGQLLQLSVDLGA